MLAMILCIVLTIGLAVLAILWNDEYDFREVLGMISAVLSILFGIVALIMIVIAIIANVGVKGEIASKQQLYESLTYQLENKVYENDNDLGKRDLYTQITDWNEDVARGKSMQHDLWLGVFYPNIYDDLEFIDISKGE